MLQSVPEIRVESNMFTCNVAVSAFEKAGEKSRIFGPSRERWQRIGALWGVITGASVLKHIQSLKPPFVSISPLKKHTNKNEKLLKVLQAS